MALAVFCGLALPPAVSARSYDGVYDGTIRCGQSTDANRVWESPFRMTVERGRARYERPVLRDGGNTGVYERGGGTVTPDGRVGLAGRADGATYVFDSQYQGTMTQHAASLGGTQLWYIGRNEAGSERSCHIELTRVPPGS
jgi:hypothetical protein